MNVVVYCDNQRVKYFNRISVNIHVNVADPYKHFGNSALYCLQGRSQDLIGGDEGERRSEA